jgi:uncharacterized membrane protein YgcG
LGGTVKDYENNLLAKLFCNRSRETSTKIIREHYSGTGFNPSTEVGQAINYQLGDIPGWNEPAYHVRTGRDIALIAAALVAMFATATLAGGSSDVAIAVFSAIAGVIVCIAAPIAGFMNSRAVTGIAARVIVVLVFLSPLFLLFAILALSGLTLHALAFFATGLWALAISYFAFDMLRTRESPQRIAIRKKLFAAKRWLIAQLHTARPLLHDDWLPHIIALGLGKNVDRWFRAHGAPSAADWTDTASTSSSSSSSTSFATPAAPSSTQWTGGGGSFAGGGATGGWAMAATAMAVGVSPPSTSSSSSGSYSGGSSGDSGGSSSGGGSMGGW